MMQSILVQSISIVVKFLAISAERMELACPLRSRVLLNVDEIKVKVNNFLYEIVYYFVERLPEEVNKTLKEASDVLIAYDAFNPDNDQRKSMLYCEKQFSVLANHYGNQIFDKYSGEIVHANCLISKNDQQAEVQYFVTEFNETFKKLKANVLEETNCKLRLNQLKREEMESYIAQHRSIPDNVYSTMCFYGYQRQFPETMKLFKFALLIPPNTANIERGFSMMNLQISPLRTSLGEKNLNRMMRVCLDGPEKLSGETDKHIYCYRVSY